MSTEDEVLRRFSDSLLLKNTVNAICSRLERVSIQSRLYRIDVKQPTVGEMRTIVQRLYTNLRDANPLLGGFPEFLAAELIKWLSKKPLRKARKLLEAALYRAAGLQMHDDTLQPTIDDLIPRKNQPRFEFPAGHA